MINWIARFGWSVALLVGIFAVLKEEKCVVLAHTAPKFSQPLQIIPYGSPGSIRVAPVPTMEITVKPYKSDKAIASWVLTSPNGHAIAAGERVVILPSEARR